MNKSSVGNYSVSFFTMYGMHSRHVADNDGGDVIFGMYSVAGANLCMLRSANSVLSEEKVQIWNIAFDASLC